MWMVASPSWMRSGASAPCRIGHSPAGAAIRPCNKVTRFIVRSVDNSALHERVRSTVDGAPSLAESRACRQQSIQRSLAGAEDEDQQRGNQEGIGRRACEFV